MSLACYIPRAKIGRFDSSGHKYLGEGRNVARGRHEEELGFWGFFPFHVSLVSMAGGRTCFSLSATSPTPPAASCRWKYLPSWGLWLLHMPLATLVICNWGPALC